MRIMTERVRLPFVLCFVPGLNAEENKLQNLMPCGRVMQHSLAIISALPEALDCISWHGYGRSAMAEYVQLIRRVTLA